MKYSRKRLESQVLALIIVIAILFGMYFIIGDQDGTFKIPFIDDLFYHEKKVKEDSSKPDPMPTIKPVQKEEDKGINDTGDKNYNYSSKNDYNNQNSETIKEEQIVLKSISSNKDIYNKNEDILLTLNINITPSERNISYVISDGSKYQVSKQNDNKYIVKVPGYKEAGKYQISISKIVLDSGKEFSLDKKIEIEVSKEKPKAIIRYNYVESEKELKVNVSLDDKDKTINGDIHVVVKDSYNVELSRQIINDIKVPVTVSDLGPGEYIIDIITDYSLTTNQKFKSTSIGQERITLETRLMELKNIDTINVYRKDNNDLILVGEDEQITNANKDNYYVEVVSNYFEKEVRSFYTTIKNVEEKNNKLELSLVSNGMVQYRDWKKKNDLKFNFPYIKEEDTFLERIKSLDNYDTKREKLYMNLYALMPYYDANYIVSDANKLSVNHDLNLKEIKTVLAYRNGIVVSALTEHDYKGIDHIKIVFTDDSNKDYEVAYYAVGNNIVTYTIDALKTNYQYRNFIINTNSDTFNYYLNKIKSYNFKNDIYPIGHSGYADRDDVIYNETFIEIQNSADEFLIKLAANNNFNFYDDNIMSNIIVKKQLHEELLKKLLFTYNYIYKWYDFEIGGVNMSDVIYFDDSTLENKIDTVNFGVDIADKVEVNYLNGNNTHNFYIKYLKPKTGINTISDFLEFYISKYAKYSDVNDWIVDNFKGIAVEIAPTNNPDKINYRIWPYMKQNQVLGKGAMLLPVLSLKSSDMYLLSVPTQLCIGTMNRYNIYDPNDPSTREAMRTKIVNFGNQVATFYDTASRIINNSDVLMNKNSNLQVDNRVLGGVVQNPLTTNDMVIKYIYGPLGITPAANGAGAYANGSGMWWVVYDLLNNFNVFTHETAHNQDGRLFLEGSGRRKGGYAEDYADGNINQSMGDGVINFNLSRNFDKTNATTSNLTLERINSRDKVGDFYKKMFTTLNMMDYLEASAFLKMSPETQSLVADKLTYPNLTEENQTTADARNTTKFSSISASDFANMNLKTIDDLWDNQIVIRPGNADGKTIGTNSYGGESIYNVYFYKAYNDYGRPDSYSFKRTAFEMLGEAGYDGYVKYYSNKNPNDLSALRDITGDPEITWRNYRLNKLKEAETQASNNTYFDQKEMIELFGRMFELDASDSNTYSNGYSTTLRNNFYHYLQRVTDDFRSDIYSSNNVVHITTGSQFVAAMKQNPNRAFILDNDISLVGFRGNESITDVTFMGSLDGNGHRITGVTQPIFTNVLYSYIRNLAFTDANIDINGENIAILAKSANRSIFTNINMQKSSVSGNTKVAGLIGTANNSVFNKISSNINVTIKQERGASIVAELLNSSITNSYSRGTVTSNSTNNGATYIGGLVGRMNNSGLNKTYSQTYVVQKNTRADRNAGGLIGRVEGTRSIINSFSVSNGEQLYRFDGHSNRSLYSSGFYNNYEYDKSSGKTHQGLVAFDMNGIINVVTRFELQSLSFYTDTLGYGSDVWNFDNIGSGYLPTLYGVDSNPKIPFDDGIKDEDVAIVPDNNPEVKEDEEDEPTYLEPPKPDLDDNKDSDSELETDTSIDEGELLIP